MNKNRVTIEIDVYGYINILEDRREYIKEQFNWTIPDGIWEYFCRMLEDGCSVRDSNPSVVVDNIAVNGDYGAIENYSELLDKLKKYVAEKLIEEGTENPTNDDLMGYVIDNKGEIMYESDIFDDAIFAYDDDSSDWGIGVCFAL